MLCYVPFINFICGYSCQDLNYQDLKHLKLTEVLLKYTLNFKYFKNNKKFAQAIKSIYHVHISRVELKKSLSLISKNKTVIS